MVGRVRVRGQGPVRRGQTTTTFKKGGRVKKASGGMSLARKLSKIDKESRRKLNPHQDAPWGFFRDRVDNPPKKKKPIRSPHADPKKRTLKDSMYHKKNKDFSELMKKAPKGAPRKPRKPRSKSNPRPFLGGLRPGVPLRRKK